MFFFCLIFCSTCLSYKRAYSEYQIFENDVYTHVKISDLCLSKKVDLKQSVLNDDMLEFS